ncbi:hypothetical protein SAMN02745166_02760 [Prosthecobacter debontii]|uniref:Uncharacterized protein n=1 Tax=Prosthecobacter debontii TaxID=48467 RepID=A0A1T4Y9F4_9BACT|nr:hypothetical protein SAMN02745166_02760 [Prosthecobacter debontii]
MRLLGIVLLIVGFLWIAWDVASGFVMDSYLTWVWQSQHLPPGDTLTRNQASGAMRELSLALKDRHRVVLIPAWLMLAGGLIAAWSRRSQKPESFRQPMFGNPSAGPADSLPRSGIT